MGRTSRSLLSEKEVIVTIIIIYCLYCLFIYSRHAFTIIRYGISKVFQNSIPDPSYFPSKSAVKPICIIDTGFSGSTHPDLSNVIATNADSSQTTIADCPSDVHGTVKNQFQMVFQQSLFIIMFLTNEDLLPSILRCHDS